ncbi:MAG: hypothetical protein HY553_16920 [Elusimicrobia bacterium]|nr:hypothetical protein [Elusimicrobiota bacterium]
MEATIARPEARPEPLLDEPRERRPRAHVSRRQACAAAAAVAAIGGSWFLSKGTATAPETPQALPVPRAESARPAPDVLVPLPAGDRAPSAAEDGLVAMLLAQSQPAVPEAPLASPAPSVMSLVESRLADKRVPEPLAKRLLKLISFSVIVERGEDLGFQTLSLAGTKRPVASFAQARTEFLAGKEEVVAGFDPKWMGKAESTGKAMTRQCVAQSLASTARAAGRKRSAALAEMSEDQDLLFSEEILAKNPGKPICRLGGSICRMPDGTFFALTSVAQFNALEAQGLVVFPSPLVFDLDGDGVRTAQRKVRFDINGDGVRDYFTDLSSRDGVLVFDGNRSGLAGDNARELFGTETDLDGNGFGDDFSDGFAALKAFVAKARKEGVLAQSPREDGRLNAEELAALERRYGLGMRIGSLAGRTVSLKEAGIAEIRLSDAKPRRIRDFDGQKNDLMRQTGALFTRTDGTEGVYEDVWFRARTKGIPAFALARK